jgi:hypothetical protein
MAGGEAADCDDEGCETWFAPFLWVSVVLKKKTRQSIGIIINAFSIHTAKNVGTCRNGIK